MTSSLSKSRLMLGRQCPKALYYSIFRKELAAPTTPAQQAVFDQGNAVGRLAQGHFPGGVLLTRDLR
jgi:hypothetical protein